MGCRATRGHRPPGHRRWRRADTPVHERRHRRGGRMTPRLATFTVFAINGAMMGTWVAHIPWLQDHLGISKATLGLCLLCMAAGALISMPLTGHILDGRSSASVTRAATLIFCLMRPLPLLATSPITLAAILFVFGASGGSMDVAMNANGVAVERKLGRPILSSLHGGWSVGGVLSAGVGAVRAPRGGEPPPRETRLGGCGLGSARRGPSTGRWGARHLP